MDAMRNKITLYDARDNTIIGPHDQFELGWVPTAGQKITLSQGLDTAEFDFRVNHVEHALHFTEHDVFQQVDIYLNPITPMAKIRAYTWWLNIHREPVSQAIAVKTGG